MISSTAESDEDVVTEAVSTLLEPEPPLNAAGFTLALWSRLIFRWRSTISILRGLGGKAFC